MQIIIESAKENMDSALFLSLVTSKQKSVSEIRSSYPSYFMSKNKI